MRTKLYAALAAALVLCSAAFAQPASPSRQEIEAMISDYIKSHPDEVGAVVKDYVVKHPEVLREIFIALAAQKKLGAQKGAAQAPNAEQLAQERAETVTANAALLFDSPRQTTLGDKSGDVVLVEFFDYNCAFCKRALSDEIALLAEDAKIKVVLKEFPVLGENSAEAARVSIAAHMQDQDGAKYLAFHRQLLSSREPATRERAMTLANELGFDRNRLERDADSDEARATLAENAKLASALHITGTPSYVIGTNVFFGAIGKQALKEQIEAMRQSKPP